MRWDMIVGGSRWPARTRSSLEITVVGHLHHGFHTFLELYDAFT